MQGFMKQSVRAFSHTLITGRAFRESIFLGHGRPPPTTGCSQLTGRQALAKRELLSLLPFCAMAQPGLWENGTYSKPLQKPHFPYGPRHGPLGLLLPVTDEKFTWVATCQCSVHARDVQTALLEKLHSPSADDLGRSVS